MNYDHIGAMAIGPGLSTNSCGDTGDINHQESRIKWDIQPPSWRETTLGELISHPGEKITHAKEAEIAFIVLNNTRGTSWRTKCRIGTSRRCKVLVIGDTEYRTEDYRLHQRALA